MRNTILLSILFISFCCEPLSAQKSKKIFNPDKVRCGDLVISTGYAVPSIIRAYLKYKTTRDQIKVYGQGPFVLKTELMLSNRFGVGLNYSYSRSKITWEDVGYDTIQQLYRKFEFGIKAYEISSTIRANYHFWKRKKIDCYAGLGIGYGMIHMASYTLAHTTIFSIVYDFPPPLSLECTWGMRYFPLKNLGVFTEVGLGKSWILFNKYFLPEALIQAGICYKIN